MVPRHALAFLFAILCVESCSELHALARWLPLFVALSAFSWWWGPKIIGTWSAGIVWAVLRAGALLNGQLPPALEGTEWLVRGTVISIPAVAEGQVRFDFAPAAQSGLPHKLQLSWFDSRVTPRAAERWQLRVRLRAPRGFANPGGFDYEGSLYRDGIGATGYVRASSDNRLLGADTVAHPLLALRAAIAQRIGVALDHAPVSGIIAGLAVGSTERISAAQWQVFATTGTTHLIAISGLHVTMVAALVMFAVRRMWRWPRARLPRSCRADVACLCGALAAAGYALLAGFSVPTQRTLVMLLIGLGAQWLRRAQPAAHVLSAALIAVLLLDPHAALTAGFWLSFVAVAAILALVGGLNVRPHVVRDFFITQRIVSLALLPATLLLFGSVSLIAPLANLLAIPAFSLVLVPVTLLGTLFLGVALPLAHASFLIAGTCMQWLWMVLEWAARLPAALLHFGAPSPALSALLAFGVVIALCALPVCARVPTLLLAPLLLASQPRLAAGDFTLTTLDVGQGLAVTVRTRAHTLLFDTGPRFRNGRSAGELAIIPYLTHAGVGRLDLLVLSHADSDHTGGAAAVVRALPSHEIREGGRSLRLIPPATRCRRGEAWIWDEVRFEFLSPGAGELWNENEGSCVLEISNAHARVLLTGDIEARAEAHIAQLQLWRAVDAIVVPHHGSRSSSSAPLVDAVAARYAIVSAGMRNRWHFPQPPVIERWCDSGAQLINTADWGAITLEFTADSGLAGVHSQRVERHHYWSAAAPLAGRSLCR